MYLQSGSLVLLRLRQKHPVTPTHIEEPDAERVILQRNQQYCAFTKFPLPVPRPAWRGPPSVLQRLPDHSIHSLPPVALCQCRTIFCVRRALPACLLVFLNGLYLGCQEPVR